MCLHLYRLPSELRALSACDLTLCGLATRGKLPHWWQAHD